MCFKKCVPVSSPKGQYQKQLERSIKRIGKRHIKVISYPSTVFVTEYSNSTGTLFKTGFHTPYMNRRANIIAKFIFLYLISSRFTDFVPVPNPMFLTGTYFREREKEK